jgi:PAS domain S-box-containing protein
MGQMASTFADYLTVGEAANLLGVSPWTLRNWDNSGKLKPNRHPISGYRIYRREELEALLRTESSTDKLRRSLTPTLDWGDIGATEHFVQFYEDDKYLVQSVATYVERALVADEGAIIIATKEHRRRISRMLKRRGIDLKACSARGQIISLDASGTLATFMIDGAPDPALFEESVGSYVKAMCETWPCVRAFGEMVALLWSEGKQDEACELESLWNDLATRQSFCLFCAYPLSAFDEEISLSDVCSCHSRVIPAESYVTLSTPDAQLRLITLLQQKAQRLEAEIDQRKAAERELTDFIENALEGLHKVGPDGIILWANKAELDLLGYAADEYIGRHIREFHTDSTAISNILQRLENGEDIYNQPATLRCKDGTLKHVLIHSNAYFEGGKFIYSRCFTRDMTEIRQGDRDREMLAAIIETSDDAIVSKTFDGIIRSWNTGAEKLFGYSATEAIGQPISLIIPPDRLGEEAEILSQLRQGKRIEHYETVRMAKDGRKLDISLTISPLKGSDGEIIGASKIARDISERTRADKALRESEERFRRLVELLPVGVYTCNSAGVITFYNSQAAALWGRMPREGDTDERFCGSFKLFLSDGKFLPHDECPMALALNEGQVCRNQEVEIERPDGSRVTVLVNIDPICDDEGNIIAAINAFHDISALKEAKTKLKEADRRKDEFLATLAHELRNPLAPIRNALNILRLTNDSGAEAGYLHEMMERQVSHMVRLVDDLLELSRISRGKIELKRENIGLASVIKQAMETSRPLVEANEHRLNVSLPDDLIMIDGDPIRLAQVFANLVNNAAKYTDKGGEIAVTATRVGSSIEVSVKDNGIGIPRDMLARVFEMFSQLDNPLSRCHGGLGIGLNLVQTLVKLHGGTVEARSEGLGLGSEFIVRLPLSDEGNGFIMEYSDNNSGESSKKAQRILCVDDNRDAANTLAMTVRFLGADVQTVYDGPSALEAIKIFRPTIVFMDLGMPGMDGLEVARRIRQDPQTEGILLVAMTGWGQTEDRQRTQQSGFDHHLVKPVDLEAIRALLGASEN